MSSTDKSPGNKVPPHESQPAASKPATSAAGGQTATFSATRSNAFQPRSLPSNDPGTVVAHRSVEPPAAVSSPRVATAMAGIESGLPASSPHSTATYMSHQSDADAGEVYEPGQGDFGDSEDEARYTANTGLDAESTDPRETLGTESQFTYDGDDQGSPYSQPRSRVRERASAPHYTEDSGASINAGPLPIRATSEQPALPSGSQGQAIDEYEEDGGDGDESDDTSGSVDDGFVENTGDVVQTPHGPTIKIALAPHGAEQKPLRATDAADQKGAAKPVGKPAPVATTPTRKAAGQRAKQASNTGNKDTRSPSSSPTAQRSDSVTSVGGAISWVKSRLWGSKQDAAAPESSAAAAPLSPSSVGQPKTVPGKPTPSSPRPATPLRGSSAASATPSSASSGVSAAARRPGMELPAQTSPATESPKVRGLFSGEDAPSSQAMTPGGTARAPMQRRASNVTRKAFLFEGGADELYKKMDEADQAKAAAADAERKANLVHAAALQREEELQALSMELDSLNETLKKKQASIAEKQKDLEAASKAKHADWNDREQRVAAVELKAEETRKSAEAILSSAVEQRDKLTKDIADFKAAQAEYVKEQRSLQASMKRDKEVIAAREDAAKAERLRLEALEKTLTQRAEKLSASEKAHDQSVTVWEEECDAASEAARLRTKALDDQAEAAKARKAKHDMREAALKARAAELDALQADNEAKLAATKAALDKETAAHAAAVAGFEQLQAKHAEQRSKSRSELQRESESLKAREAAAAAEKARLDGLAAQLAKDQAALKSKQEEFDRTTSTWKSRCKEQEQTLKAREDHATQLKADLDAEVTLLSRRLEKCAQRETAIGTKETKAKSAVADAKQKVQDATALMDAAREKEAAVEQLRMESQAHRREADKELTHMRTQLEAAKEHAARSDAECQQQVQTVHDMAAEMAQRRSDATRLRSQCKKLKKQLQEMRDAMRSNGQAEAAQDSAESDAGPTSPRTAHHAPSLTMSPSREGAVVSIRDLQKLKLEKQRLQTTINELRRQLTESEEKIVVLERHDGVLRLKSVERWQRTEAVIAMGDEMEEKLARLSMQLATAKMELSELRCVKIDLDEREMELASLRTHFDDAKRDLEGAAVDILRLQSELDAATTQGSRMYVQLVDSLEREAAMKEFFQSQAKGDGDMRHLSTAWYDALSADNRSTLNNPMLQGGTPVFVQGTAEKPSSDPEHYRVRTPTMGMTSPARTRGAHGLSESRASLFSASTVDTDSMSDSDAEYGSRRSPRVRSFRMARLHKQHKGGDAGPGAGIPPPAPHSKHPTSSSPTFPSSLLYTPGSTSSHKRRHRPRHRPTRSRSTNSLRGRRRHHDKDVWSMVRDMTFVQPGIAAAFMALGQGPWGPDQRRSRASVDSPSISVDARGPPNSLVSGGTGAARAMISAGTQTLGADLNSSGRPYWERRGTASPAAPRRASMDGLRSDRSVSSSVGAPRASSVSHRDPVVQQNPLHNLPTQGDDSEVMSVGRVSPLVVQHSTEAESRSGSTEQHSSPTNSAAARPTQPSNASQDMIVRGQRDVTDAGAGADEDSIVPLADPDDAYYYPLSRLLADRDVTIGRLTSKIQAFHRREAQNARIQSLQEGVSAIKFNFHNQRFGHKWLALDSLRTALGWTKHTRQHELPPAQRSPNPSFQSFLRLSDIQAVSRRLPTSAELEAVRDFQQGFWRQPHAATSELVLVIEAESRSYRFLLQTQQQTRDIELAMLGLLEEPSALKLDAYVSPAHKTKATSTAAAGRSRPSTPAPTAGHVHDFSQAAIDASEEHSAQPAAVAQPVPGSGAHQSRIDLQSAPNAKNKSPGSRASTPNRPADSPVSLGEVAEESVLEGSMDPTLHDTLGLHVSAAGSGMFRRANDTSSTHSVVSSLHDGDSTHDPQVELATSQWLRRLRQYSTENRHSRGAVNGRQSAQSQSPPWPQSGVRLRQHDRGGSVSKLFNGSPRMLAHLGNQASFSPESLTHSDRASAAGPYGGSKHSRCGSAPSALNDADRWLREQPDNHEYSGFAPASQSSSRTHGPAASTVRMAPTPNGSPVDSRGTDVTDRSGVTTPHT